MKYKIVKFYVNHFLSSSNHSNNQYISQFVYNSPPLQIRWRWGWGVSRDINVINVSQLIYFSSNIGLKQATKIRLLCSLCLSMILLNFVDIFTTSELRLFMLLYADDAVIFAKSPRVLQSLTLLHDLETYCFRWSLKR